MDVFIVDGHPLMRFGIRTFLSAAGDMRVVGEYAEGEEALRLVEAARPDLVILGLNPMGDTDGIELCWRIKRLPEPPRILIHTAYNFPDDLASGFLAGADGFLHKSFDMATFLDAVRSTVDGKRPWLPGGRIGEPRSRLDATPEGVRLTPREREILGLLLHRYPNADIAETLYLSEQTVKNHVGSVLRKFGVRSRKELLSKASVHAG